MINGKANRHTRCDVPWIGYLLEIGPDGDRKIEEDVIQHKEYSKDDP